MSKRTMDIVEYDKNWMRLFEIEKELLSDIFKDNVIRIEHFGSTSIPGIAAKPIIDIMIFVYDINKIELYDDKMKELGYTPKGENGMTGRRYFVKYKEDLINHTHHVHIYEEGGNPFIYEAFLFRDYLRVNEAARKKYEKTKKELAKQFYFEPLAYTDGKNACVAEILEEAKYCFH